MNKREIPRSVVIYFSSDKSGARQIIHPSSEFNGGWKALVEAVTGGGYHSFDIN